MGSSGAGKSTFLDILAQRNKAGWISGEILLDGHPVIKNMFRRVSGYVVQEDILMSTMTVRECIEFSAECRLPYELSAEEKKGYVDDVIKETNLEHIQHSKIGGFLNRSISGGEKRRVSIAMELVANPSILLLDEPTSGLDAFNAYQIVKLLSDITLKGRTVIFSIHQPRSSIFALLNDLILLSEGEMAYMGPANAAIDHFGKLGYQMPNSHSPPDFLIDLLEKVSRSDTTGSDRQGIIEGFVPKVLDPPIGTQPPKWEDYPFATSFFEQFHQLSKRSFWNFVKNPLLLGGHLMMSILLGFGLGGLYYQQASNFVGIQNRIGVLTFLLITLALGAMTSLETFLTDKQVFIRERANNYYRTSAYFLSKILFDVIPLRVLPAVIIGSIAYPMIGFKSELYSFAWFILLLSLFSIISGGICFIIGSLISSLSISNLFAVTISLFGLLYGGILINNNETGWIRFLSSFQYCMENLLTTEMIGKKWMFDPPGFRVPIVVEGEYVLEYFGYTISNFARNLGVMFGISIVTFLISGIILYIFSRERR